MAQQQSQPDAAETETPAEGAAATEGEDTSATGTEPEAGAPTGDAGAEGEKPAETEQTEEEKAAAAKEASEWDIKVKAAAEKYAKEQISQANRTMAAARRAEKAAKETAERSATELATAKQSVQVYSEFVEQLRTKPMEALARVGFPTVKSLLDFIADQGGDREPTQEERLEALLSKKLDEREAPRKQREQAQAIEESKKAVFAYVDSLPDRFDLVTTDVGHDKLWRGIEAYHRKHGVVPDAAVELIADEIEKELGASLSKTKKFGQRQPASNGATATGAAAPGASSSGKSLAGKAMSGAPAPRKYSDDPDERRAQVNEDLRREGLI